MDYTLGPIDAVDPAQGFVARSYDGAYQAIVAQAALDLGGAGGAIDDARSTIGTLAADSPTTDLAAHEADLQASQDDDDAALPGFTLDDELTATDAGAASTDTGATAARDTADAHAALTPKIADGRADVPVPPADLPPDSPYEKGDWQRNYHPKPNT